MLFKALGNHTKIVQHFYEVSFLQTRCIQERKKSMMYVISSTSTLKPTNVSWILGLLTKARWMWPVEVTIIVFYLCYCQALVSPGCRVWKPKPFFYQSEFRIQVFIQSEFLGVLYIELEIPISLAKLESGSICGSFKLIPYCWSWREHFAANIFISSYF